MKYSSLGGPGISANRWRFKSTTVKAFMVCLFTFSAVFITYQLIYYVNLTEYQSKESHHRQLERLSSNGNEISDINAIKVKSTEKPDSQVVFAKIPDSNLHAPPHSPGGERKKGKPLLSSRILGVRPTDLHYYQDQQTNDKQYFKCLSAHKQISWDKVNDDYCDCPFDGSDEPSTSACENGKFYCLRRDGTKDFISSSRVNDGICDCLDGTDEHAGLVKCKKVSPYF